MLQDFLFFTTLLPNKYKNNQNPIFLADPLQDVGIALIDDITEKSLYLGTDSDDTSSYSIHTDMYLLL